MERFAHRVCLRFFRSRGGLTGGTGLRSSGASYRSFEWSHALFSLGDDSALTSSPELKPESDIETVELDEQHSSAAVSEAEVCIIDICDQLHCFNVGVPPHHDDE